MALREEGYWEEKYSEELETYLKDGDEGDIWFGKKLTRQIVELVLKRMGSASDTNKLEPSAPVQVIDIGCGNSFLLCSLVEKFRERFGQASPPISIEAWGVDYSESSIKLSSKIVEDRLFSEHIALRVCDFTDHEEVAQILSPMGKRDFDYIIDKGTFDAICLLNGKTDPMLKQAQQKYMKSIGLISKKGTIFILASCNYSREELSHSIEQAINRDDDKQRPVPTIIDDIQTPSMEFGGKKGSLVTCLVYEFM